MSFGSEMTHSFGFFKFIPVIVRTTFLVPAVRPVTALATEDVVLESAFDNIIIVYRLFASVFC